MVTTIFEEKFSHILYAESQYYNKLLNWFSDLTISNSLSEVHNKPYLACNYHWYVQKLKLRNKEIIIN